MSFLKLILFLCSISLVNCKGTLKGSALTESMGQEVIEIGNPIKELPPGFEEEPSAENDDEPKVTVTTLQAATKKIEIIKTTPEIRRKGVTVKEESNREEARIEKELAEIYRDNTANDYSAETPKEDVLYKPIGRAGFKFQPDLSNKAEVERFRTSVDDIACDKGLVKKLEYSVATDKSISETNSAFRYLVNVALLSVMSVILLS